MTRASPTAGCAESALSISPGSMRKPRIFTCSSSRPMNSSVPSAFQRSRSPVRYIRAPGSRGERIGDEALRRQPGTVQVAAHDAVAAHVRLPRHARWGRARSAGVQDVDALVPGGPAHGDGERVLRPRAPPSRTSTTPSSPWGRTCAAAAAACRRAACGARCPRPPPARRTAPRAAGRRCPAARALSWFSSAVVWYSVVIRSARSVARSAAGRQQHVAGDAHERGAVQQRAPHLERQRVEAGDCDACATRSPGASCDVVRLAHQLDHVPVLHHHALGPPRGAGGVDDVRQVLRRRAALAAHPPAPPPGRPPPRPASTACTPSRRPPRPRGPRG